jgi:hypothetical protein
VSYRHCVPSRPAPRCRQTGHNGTNVPMRPVPSRCPDHTARPFQDRTHAHTLANFGRWLTFVIGRKYDLLWADINIRKVSKSGLFIVASEIMLHWCRTWEGSKTHGIGCDGH